MIATVGNENKNIPRQLRQESIIKGLKQAVGLLKNNGITLVVEPLNTLVNHPGYYLWSSDEAAEIITKVNSPYVKILFNFYHQQIMEGNLISRSLKYMPPIGHVHCAGNPGRNELNNGEINYSSILVLSIKQGMEDT